MTNELKDFRVCMRNEDGEKDYVTVSAEKVKHAIDEALEEANNGDSLPGVGWVVTRVVQI